MAVLALAVLGSVVAHLEHLWILCYDVVVDAVDCDEVVVSWLLHSSSRVLVMLKLLLTLGAFQTKAVGVHSSPVNRTRISLCLTQVQQVLFAFRA